MVDRILVYPYEQPTDTMFLSQAKNNMVGLGYALQAILGTSTLADGLACSPTIPASMMVQVQTGSIYSYGVIDPTAYGTLGADNGNVIVKQGIALGSTNFSCPAPGSAGQSVVYLIQAQYQDADSGTQTLSYYNAANPSVSWVGPNNSGTAQNTVRQGKCVLALKGGTPATTGSQTAPAPDAGYVGLWAITVASGSTTITSANIAPATNAPFIGVKLTGKLSAVNNLSEVGSPPTALANLGGAPLSAFAALGNIGVFISSGTYTTPSDSSTATQYRVSVYGAGGGGGGSSATYAAGGGGGAGGIAIGILTNLAPNAGIAVTIGTGGAGGTSGTNGSGGGGSSFGAYLIGGGGGGGGGSSTNGSSGGGGTGGVPTYSGVANAICYLTGQYGGLGNVQNAGTSIGNGGQGGAGGFGPGGFGAVTNSGTGLNAPFFGGGGGGGVGAVGMGGNGSGGYVKVERITL